MVATESVLRNVGDVVGDVVEGRGMLRRGTLLASRRGSWSAPPVVVRLGWVLGGASMRWLGAPGRGVVGGVMAQVVGEATMEGGGKAMAMR